MFTVTKQYRDLPAAHRQPKHDGHCRQIHGHNWGFDITFTCETLDSNGFVVDVGRLKQVKQYLERMFDHTLLINGDDPLLDMFKEWDEQKLVSLVVVKNCGMEALAALVHRDVQGLIPVMGPDHLERGLAVTQVVCWEDGKNSATYRP